MYEVNNLPSRSRVVGVGEVSDPADHLRCSEAIARALEVHSENGTPQPRRLRKGENTFEIERSGKSDTIARPPSSMSEEVVCLRRVCKVVPRMIPWLVAPM